jgi:hypothetical protein
MDVCSKQQPPTLQESDHQFACWWAKEHPRQTIPMEVTHA